MAVPYVSPKHPPGLVAWCETGYARCRTFHHSLRLLEVPQGTSMEVSVGTGLASMWNGLFHGIRDDCRWIWMLGDDHEFRPDVLKRMLIRAELYELPVVVPLVCKKLPPFDSVLFDLKTTKPMDFHDLPKGDDPVEIHAAGTAGMLIQRNVIDKIGAPWFRIGWGSPDASDEDVYFCHRVRECGFKIYVDPTVSLSHIPPEVLISPKRFPNGEWYVEFRWPDSRSFAIPMQRPIR
jgi:hypothetical protein